MGFGDGGDELQNSAGCDGPGRPVELIGGRHRNVGGVRFLPESEE